MQWQSESSSVDTAFEQPMSMKFQNRCLLTLVYLIPTIIVLGVLYIASYFIVMERGMAFNPRTFTPEYPSFNRFIESERSPGDISIYFTPSHWTNRFFSPLDRIFRHSKLTAIKTRRAELIEFRKCL